MGTMFMVAKRVKLLANGRVYTQGNILCADDAGNENVARFMRKGYIKPLTDAAGHTAASGDWDGDDDLTVEEINKLTKPRLLAYAAHIGMENVDNRTKVTDIRQQVVAFLEDEEDFEDAESDEDESDDEADGNNGV